MSNNHDKPGLSKEKLELLRLLLQEEGFEAGSSAAIKPRPADSPAPLSFAQERLWFLDQIEPDNLAYNIPLSFHLTGPLDYAALQRSFAILIQRHEILRTTFQMTNGQPHQLVAPSPTFELSVVDFRRLPDDGSQPIMTKYIEERIKASFNLSAGPLWWAELLVFGPESHMLLLNFHHVIVDGESIDILLNELTLAYLALQKGEEPQLPDPGISYGDYAAWQRERMQGPLLEKQIAYWKQQLAGARSIMPLPKDRSRPPLKGMRGRDTSFDLPATLVNKLERLGQDNDTTLFTTLMAAFNTLIYRYSGVNDILIGTPVSNRHRPELEELVGLFVNILVIRGRPAGQLTFNSFLQQIRDTILQAFEHQELPFERLVDELHIKRDLSRNPLFQVMFAFEQPAEEQFDLLGLETRSLPVRHNTAKFDLTLFVTKSHGKLSARFEYNHDLFDDSTITRLVQHFQILLANIAQEPDSRLVDLPLLPDYERQEMLEQWNDTQVGIESFCFQQLFEIQVGLTPSKPAISFGQEVLGYAELNKRANQLANYLNRHGVGPETVVGVFVEPSVELVIGLLGILKAGGAYLPLDTGHPQQRIAFMLQDARVNLVLTRRNLLDRLPSEISAIPLDSAWALIEQESAANLPSQPQLDQLAYVMYTSGSTGNPKGVMLTHGGLTNYIQWAVQNYPFVDGQAVPVHSSISFDLTITSLFAPLAVGQQVQLLPEKEYGLDTLGAAMMEDVEFSVVKLTPAHLSLLSHRVPPALAATCARAMVIGGEQLMARHVQFWRDNAPHVRLFNEYGPTETVVGCCVYELLPTGKMAEVIPIGRPIANTQLYILDSFMNPVPIGAIGELYIGGAGVARGYLNRPRQTAEKFVPNPFSSESGDRLYRSGDLARYLPDGLLQYVGRADEQVKIRGFRIELGEIEAALGRHPQVSNAVVVVHERSPDDRRLAAYIVGTDGANPLEEDLRHLLADLLPAHMLPSSYTFLDELPLTANRKVDRAALSRPETPIEDDNALSARAPADRLETQIIRIFEQLLQVKPVGLSDDFFALGGHSLLAVRLLSRIKNEFGTNIALTSLFQDSTVQHLVNLVRQQSGLIEWSSLVTIQEYSEDQKLPFFCVHGITGDVYWYGQLAKLVGSDQPFYGLQSKGLDGVQQPLITIQEMAAHYIKEMRAAQPAGPYLLGGYSYGGNVAFEMAQQLVASGQTVALLAILDDVPNGSDYYQTRWNLATLISYLQYLRYRPQDITALNYKDLFKRMRRKIFAAARQFGRAIRPSSGTATKLTAEELVDNAAELPDRVRQIIELNYRAMESYRPQPYPGRITLLRATGDRLFTSHEHTMGWGELAQGGVEVEVIPGTHLGIFREPHVHDLAETLRKHLDSAHRRVTQDRAKPEAG